MNQDEIKNLLDSFADKQERTLLIVDYGNVEKWKGGLGWDVGIRELSKLGKHFSKGSKYLRRFYYGSDFGENEKHFTLEPWSAKALETALFNNFEVVTKRVKYIHSKNNIHGFEKKCDLDVEMTVDLIKERDNYDTAIIFSGDGDLMHAVKYLHDEYQKNCYVFGARGHVGREVYNAKKNKIIKDIFYVEDFEYRLNSKRWR